MTLEERQKVKDAPQLSPLEGVVSEIVDETAQMADDIEQEIRNLDDRHIAIASENKLDNVDSTLQKVHSGLARELSRASRTQGRLGTVLEYRPALESLGKNYENLDNQMAGVLKRLQASEAEILRRMEAIMKTPAGASIISNAEIENQQGKF